MKRGAGKAAGAKKKVAEPKAVDTPAPPQQQKPEPVAPEPERPRELRAPPGHNVVYGFAWPKGKSLLPLELQCYRQNWAPERGGLGALAHFRNAWKILWPKFEWNDWTRLMVEGWCGYSRVSVMGHAAAGKTFTYGRIALLDWLAHPGETMTSLATVTAEGLRLRMWADLMRAYEELPPEVRMLLRVYNTPNRMAIMLEGGSDKFVIEGMCVSRNKDALGRIRGKHAPRRRVIYDEADDMSEAAYDAMANIMTDPDVKIVDMSNAMDRYSQFGRACEPAAGWRSVDETVLAWEGKPAANFRSIVLHLDGLQNPNVKGQSTVKPGEKKYPYMLGPGEIEAIRVKYGEDSKEWWTMVRGFFPPEGMVAKIFPGSVIERARPQVKWDFQPEMCATLDPGFEHDDCAFILGEKGTLRDGRRAISAVKSEAIVTKESADAGSKDWQIAERVMALCVQAGVKPENFIMDKTGGGRGVYAILERIWSNQIQGINYGGEASERPLRQGDSDKAKDVVRYFVSELWFRARYLCEDGLLGGLDAIDPKAINDLNARRYDTKQVTTGRIMQAESKDEMKKRLGRSPDFGDAYCQFGELLARELSKTITLEERKLPTQRWNQSFQRVKKLRKAFGTEAVEVEVW